MKLRGIHHITAIATEPQANLDFYVRVLGLRFVKRTVNFDDPSAYHFYFGDRTGRPGTAITFFPWPGARRGSRGVGQVVAVSYAISPDLIDFWKSRFNEHHISCEEGPPRFGDRVLRFADPDGLLLELIATLSPGASRPPLPEGEADSNAAGEGQTLLGEFHAPTLEVKRALKTEKVLGALGLKQIAEENGRRRFSVNETSTSASIDLIERVDGEFGVNSAGTVHHIAFRCADEEEQLQWRDQLVDLGLHVTPVIDRQYFHSIYFREPGGILFEIATENPGFTADEPVEHLGENLKLPPKYEAHRAEIERALPPISLPR